MIKAITNAALAAALLFASVTCVAQPYLGVNVGRADLDASVDLGLAPNSVSRASATDDAYKLYGGYKLTPNFGVEIGYAVHGEVKLPLSGLIRKLEPRSGYVAATGEFPLAQNFALLGKVGVANSRKAGDNKTGSMFGAGVSYAFTPAVSAVLEYEHFRKLGDPYVVKSQLISAGMRFGF